MNSETNQLDCFDTAPDEDVFKRLNFVGESAAFKRAVELIQRIAHCDATALIQGETGTGKELAARAIHYLGARREYPFIPVNCGAIPDNLMESELFGHVRGAFTDAKDARPGVIAQATGGTLLLDEIEALSGRGQVALLRFLQDREYRPVGGAVRNANVRVIAASNADLDSLVRKGQYRQDLLFRLNVLRLDLPPLRGRQADALLLAQSFLKRFSQQFRRPVKTLHPDAVQRMLRHDWPGNVRELENLIQREVLLTDDPVVHLRCLERCDEEGGSERAAPLKLTDATFQRAKAHVIASFERAYIIELLDVTRGNISQAARISGKERSYLGKLLKKHGLQRTASAQDA